VLVARVGIASRRIALEPPLERGRAEAVVDEAEAVWLDDERVEMIVGFGIGYHGGPEEGRIGGAADRRSK
jgi:hypothetical protein